MTLNPKNVPLALVPLLSMAERWGIGDDFDREEAISKARVDDLEKLIRCTDGVPDGDLSAWLIDPASFNPKPSAEYLAITCLTMARDSAKVEMQARRMKS